MCLTTERSCDDEQVGEAELVLQVLEQVEHLGADRDVERAHRLVEHDELGVERQGAGDADALALPAGELVRVALGVLGVEAHRVQQLGDPLLALGLGADAVDLERLADDVADAHARVQRARTGPGRRSACPCAASSCRRATPS